MVLAEECSIELEEIEETGETVENVGYCELEEEEFFLPTCVSSARFVMGGGELFAYMFRC